MSPRTAVFITMATAISSLGHGLHLTAVPINSALYIFVVAKSSTIFGWSKGGNATFAGGR